MRRVIGFILCTVLVLNIANCKPSHSRRTCGYEGCTKTKNGMINVHLVPHTHDDVGWLKTAEQYYYGSKNRIQRAGVQYILDSVIQALIANPERRFIYVESEFFFKWWDEQTPELQKQVKQLVEEGRLEFAGGAWSMNDEADVHYQSVIDQFALGLKRLNETFGKCGRPHIGWQIDPFGHSREMASIFAQMGFDGEFFARLDWVDKNVRLNTQTAEMIWHGSANVDPSNDLFTGVLYNHYSAPPGFCFDTLCQDDPIIDSRRSSEYNVDTKVQTFIKYVENLSTYYRTQNVMVPMGDDFNYQDANMNFKNMDKLIKYVNALQTNGSTINVFYSSPACYLKSLHDANITWPEKKEDFFPYSTDPYSYWTGYYTSRPTGKRFERDGNHFLQVCKQLSVLAKLNVNSALPSATSTYQHENNLNKLREVMGIMQHHDAITGTEKQHVSDDYEKLLYEGMGACGLNTQAALRKLTPYPTADFNSCLNLNISSCSDTEDKDKFMITVYNPLSSSSTQYIRVPVHEGSYTVKDDQGKVVPSEMVPIPTPIDKLPFRISTSLYELVFGVTVDKLESFHVTKSDSKLNFTDNLKEGVAYGVHLGPNTISNNKVRVTFDHKGHVSHIEMNNVSAQVSQGFSFYNAAAGNNAVFANRSSGAYIFRPNGTASVVTDGVEIEIKRGLKVQEVHQKFNDWISQVVRIYEDKSFVEFEWLVGPIPIGDKVGKEVVSRFQSNINSNGVFFTDSNGREMLKRRRNQRELFEPISNVTASSNYYPITTKIALEDENLRMAVLNDRSQGGSSLEDGVLELMVHRRLLNDDAFGVGEALNETTHGEGLIARGKHYLTLGPTSERTLVAERRLQLETLLPFWKFFSLHSSPSQNNRKLLPSLKKLPSSVNLLTLEPWTKNQILLRFENILEELEGRDVTINIYQFFKELDGVEIREPTLDGSMWLSDMERLKFAPDATSFDNNRMKSAYAPLFATETNSLKSDFDILLKPMSIRTFVVTVKV